MAYFAKLGTGNIVEKVISINNSIITDSNGIEQEQIGVDFINSLYGTNDIWKQTSYNTKAGKYYNLDNTLGEQSKSFRKNYAGIGYQYDQQRDAFIPPKPFNSWILNENTCIWESPVAYPITNIQNLINEFGNPQNDLYKWNEQILSWDLLDNS
jgi:hypothetical protein